MADEVLGVHHIVELCECNSELLNDVNFIKNSLLGAVEIAKATLIGNLEYEFTPHGVTAICLLAESHISIHTWPEKGYAAMDIFTCGNHTMPNVACDYMISVLECKQPKVTVLSRGI